MTKNEDLNKAIDFFTKDLGGGGSQIDLLRLHAKNFKVRTGCDNYQGDLDACDALEIIIAAVKARPTVTPTDGDAERLIKYLELSLPQIIYSIKEDGCNLLMDYQSDMTSEIIIGCIKAQIALQSTSKPERELDAPEKQVMHDALRSSVKVVSKPPVDTIAVPKEVLQSMRGALQEVLSSGDYSDTSCASIAVTNCLASLDAVLAEGE